MRNKLLHLWALLALFVVTLQGFAQSDVPKTLSLGYDTPDQSEAWDGFNMQNAPALFTYTYSGSQTLYMPEQLADMKDKDITALSFKYFIEECYVFDYNSTLKLYLHEVDNTEFQKNESGKCLWEQFDASSAIATLDFNPAFGDNNYGDDQEITFDLSANPYHYTGKTLVVTVANDGNQYIESGVRFYWIPSSATDPWRSLVYGSEDTDFLTNQAGNNVLDGNEDKWKNAPVVKFAYQSSSNPNPGPDPKPDPDPKPQPTEGKLTLGHFMDQNSDAAWDGFNLQNAPVIYTYNHSGSQVLYSPEELAGMKNQWLTSLTFKCFAQDCYPAELYGSTMKLYVQEVDSTGFEYDAATEYYQWYAFDATQPQATVEFSADFADAAVNMTDIEVKFDLTENPFYYTGKTLLVTLVNDSPVSISEGGIRFYWIDSKKEDPWRSLVFASDKTDFLTNQQKDLAVKTLDNEDKWKNAPAVEFTYKAGDAPEPPTPGPDPTPDPEPNPDPETDPDPLPDPNATSETLTLGHYDDGERTAAWDGFNLQNAPVIFTYNHSGSQVLYTPDELAPMKGQHLTSISFKCFAEDYYAANPYTSSLKLYLQEYDGTAFPYNAEGEFYEWIPFDEKKVIATADFAADFMDASINQTEVEVKFDFGTTPYYYHGQTLLVTVVNDAPECLDNSQGPVRFYWIDAQKDDSWRSLVFASDTKDFYENQKVDLAVKTTDNEDKWMNAPAVHFTYLKSGGSTPEPPAPTWFSGGEGTDENPYLLSKAEDLTTLSAWCDEAKTDHVYFVLTTDLTETPITEPIGQMHGFKGYLDGQNHTLQLNIEKKHDENVGLFATVEGGSIRNLQLTGTVRGKKFVGALAGIVGNSTVIENVVNYSSVKGNMTVGGLVGQLQTTLQGAQMTQCANYGDVTASMFIVGGLVGESVSEAGNTIERIANYGTVQGMSTAAGLIGRTSALDQIAYGLNLSTAGSNSVAGCIATTNEAKVSQVYYDAQYITYENGTAAEKKQTAELLGQALMSVEEGSGFDAAHWLFTEHLAPRLKVCGADTTDIALLYATPLLLAEGNTLLGVDSDFNVCTDNGVTWSAANGLVQIDGNAVKHIGEGEEVLTASYKGLTRTFQLTLLKKKPIAFSGGEGTAELPFLISSLEDLATLDTWCNQNKTDGVYFELTTDLTETPVTRKLASEIDFFGHFDGQGHTVRVDINEPEGMYVGLFGAVQNGSVRNLVVEGSVSGAYYVGGVAGQVSQGSVIENVINCAEVSAQMWVGGITGQIVTQKPFNGTVVRQCANYGNVVGNDYVGGIIGDSGQQVGNLFERLANYGHINAEPENKGTGGVFGNVRPEDHVHYVLNAGTTETEDIAGCIGNTKSEDLLDLYYDAQHFSNPAPTFGSAMLTADLLGDGLRVEEADHGFSDQYWLFAQNMYPRLKINGWENTPMAILYATPVLLSAESTLSNIQESFQVGTENGVTWSSKNGLVEFNGNEATTLRSGDDILVATCQGVTREIPVTITVPTGLTDLTEADRNSVTPAEGALLLHLTESAFVQVYNAAGQPVANGHYAAGEHRLAVPAGFYVVRLGNGAQKVCVR